MNQTDHNKALLGHPQTLLGVISHFDAEVAIGTIRCELGEIEFHATSLTDASRVAIQGEEVAFSLSASRGGRPQAVSVSKIRAISDV